MRAPSLAASALVASLACAPAIAPTPRTTPPPLPLSAFVSEPPPPPSYDCAAPSGGAADFGFAMVPVCDDVYVDPETPPPRLDLMKTTPARAAERIVAWYGPLRAPRPRVVFCDTDACRLFFAGPAKRGWDVRRGRSAPGAPYVSRNRVTLVIVCADAQAERMLAHELSHEELAFRTQRARVPAWFDEGLATHLSGEPDSRGPRGPSSMIYGRLTTAKPGRPWRRTRSGATRSTARPAARSPPGSSTTATRASQRSSTR